MYFWRLKSAKLRVGKVTFSTSSVSIGNRMRASKILKGLMSRVFSATSENTSDIDL